MTTELVSVEPSVTVETRVSEVARLMRQSGVKEVFVLAGRKPIGFVRESDIVTKVVAEGLNAERVRAKDIMLKPVPTVGPKAGLAEIADVAAKMGVSRLLVVERDRSIGTLTGGQYLAVISCLSRGTMRFCRALGSGPRLKILELLSSEPLTVRQISKRLNLRPITVRHHLQLLIQAGTIEEYGEERSRAGRPSLRYGLAPTLLRKS